jgi:beta-galactosidase/beta-glucuronidase
MMSLDPQDSPLAGARGYPRPQLRRASWSTLDGTWAFAFDAEGQWALPAEVRFDRSIIVPFAPETRRSGVAKTGFYRACWYQRSIRAPVFGTSERLILHFAAVDYGATVWIDDVKIAAHEGGYTPFETDVTDMLRDGEEHVLVVRAEDDPSDLSKPRGKQDWQLEPHSIWYPRTTGIWQTVWLEVCPRTRITSLRWTSNLERWEIAIEALVAAAKDERNEPLRLSVKLRARGLLLADDTYLVVAGEVHRRIALSDPGIDDSRNELLWSPSSPTLVDATLELWCEGGELLDRVDSYTALRSVTTEGDRILLNNRPYPLRMVLDQGYWPDTGATAPDDAALRRDVELAKAMGFNGVRKHQKLEEPRYLFWADVLGLLVWEEMPSAYRFTRRSVERVTREWMEALKRDISHPCIIAWAPFNESWGVPNLPDVAAERHYVEALYHLTKTLDPTRLVVGNDGWEHVATDLIGIHDYDPDPERLKRRYPAADDVPRMLQRERPGGRLLVVGDRAAALSRHPIMLSEFGGIAYSEDGVPGTWGYARARTPEALESRYAALLAAIHSIRSFSGFCYTQFADTYQEANGLLYADRRPKFALDRMALATRDGGVPLDAGSGIDVPPQTWRPPPLPRKT